ncbi:response regulator receiver protein [Desulfofarcimen acetoxidans DSM 771]|jgi:two-component system LytT family response regulator|uniref:Response regulator receiver protein n=1 Tax=Desulfofarcimen acetoxidans (strain ATCC 49208 / DSM 771 / KCTC 5769 / VKM B-1644 / 5575) TaxID=485916 RepID=C8VYC5_DESAS|nr:LytTR family DNA-binding domain-containing protein [Desulfofarcimen acetoxidans]ACV62806.1 response regulator receiver protein [Desulfofarcimen acetoxidans DSM 771]
MNSPETQNIEFFNDIICFRIGCEKIFISKDEIIMFSTNGRKVDVHTPSCRFTVNITLNEIQKKLDDTIFFRSHQSYLVNIKMVKKIFSKGETRCIEFRLISETAQISKGNERKLFEMVRII